ncbi:MAG: hypothetical protein WCP28_12585 [Actinomycetes bacterium]
MKTLLRRNRLWLLPLVVAAGLAVGVAPAQAQYITMALPSFTTANTSGFILDGVHAPSRVPELPAFCPYIPAGTGVIRLTDSATWLAGTAVSKQLIDLPDDRSFSSFFSWAIPSHGADGLVFILQGATNTPKMLGGGMGFLGKPNSQPRSLAIEFDTFNNGASDNGVTVNDPSNNHIGVDLNGSEQSVVTTSPPGSADLAGKPWNVWVDYDGGGQMLQIRMSRTTARPALPTLAYPIDLTQVIGQDVYTGFAAGTGAACEQHDLMSLYFDSSYLPGGITPSTTQYSSAPDVAFASSGATQTVAPGSTTTLTATFQDSLGNVVAQMPATFTADGGSIKQLAPATDASGQVSASFTAPSTPGTYTVIASGSGAISTSFTETVPDVTAPSTAAFGVPAGWSSTPATLTLVAADDVGTSATYYAINGAIPQRYMMPLSISTEGTTTVTYWSVDVAGNAEAVRTAVVRVDATPPTVAIFGVPAWIVRAPVTFSLSGADAGSGVASLYCRLGAETEQPYVGPITVSQAGTTVVSYRAVDAAGNSSVETTAAITIHHGMPTSSVSGVPGGWVCVPVTLTVDAADPDGEAVRVLWSADGSAPVNSGVPLEVPVSGEGTHTVVYRAINGSGVTEDTEHRAVVRIDTSPPVSSAAGIPAGATPGPVTVTLAGDDTLSGVDSIYYSLDAAPAAPYSGHLSVSSIGTSTLSWWAVDSAGNREATQCAQIVISSAQTTSSVPATPAVPPTAPPVPDPPPIDHHIGQINGDVTTNAHLGITVTGADLHYGSPAFGSTGVTEINGTRTVLTNTGDVTSGLYIQGDGPALVAGKAGSWDMAARAGSDAFAWRFTGTGGSTADVTTDAAADLGTLGFDDSADFGSSIDMPVFSSHTGAYRWSATVWVTAP